MATVQDIITRALRRAGITRLGESPQARLSIEALDILNDMLYALPNEGINIRLDETRTAEFVLSDTFQFFVPPENVLQDSVDKFSYQGTWDATANSPALTNGSGTIGYCYRVSTAGTTTLNSQSDWDVNDYIFFGQGRPDNLSPYSQTDSNWYRGVRSRRFHDGVAAMLPVRLAEELGHEINGVMIDNANKGRQSLFNFCSKPKDKNLYDTGIVYTPTWARFNTDEAI